MRRIARLLLPAFLAALAVPRAAAAQPSPAELLYRANTVLAGAAAGVREYRAVLRSAYGEVKVYARLVDGVWQFQHDAKDDVLTTYVMIPLEMLLLGEEPVVMEEEMEGARASVSVDSIRGRPAHRLTLVFDPKTPQAGENLVKRVVAFDAETYDVLQQQLAIRMAPAELELTEPWIVETGADLSGYADHGGVRFPRRLHVWGRNLLPPLPPEERRELLAQANAELDQLRSEPASADLAGRIAEAELVVQMIWTGGIEVDVEVVRFRANAGPPAGFKVRKTRDES